MKAIHNTCHGVVAVARTVFNTTNIQNESNSQPHLLKPPLFADCIQYYKYTK